MTKLKLGILGTLALASVATPLVISHQTQSRLREENESLRQQVTQLQQLAAENDRLSNEVAQAQASQVLAKDQASELLRLRGEAGGLREQKKEWDKLKTALAADRTHQPVTPGESVKPDRIPRESWAFAGYTSPEAALQSVVWAMSKGDVKTFLASATPETQKLMAQQFAGKTDGEIATSLADEIRGLAELPLGNKLVLADGAVTFRVAVSESDNGATKTRDEAVMSFQNVGGEWKYTVDSGTAPSK